MILLTFLIGLLLGTLIGTLFAVRFLHREITANIGPRLQRIQNQIDQLESGVDTALRTQVAEAAGGYGSIPEIRDRRTDRPMPQGPPGPDFEDDDDEN